ncbi:hypothetical protein EV363DRAFT_1428959 [Boletus edulis]|nr:hypothetical protein EV363DRAFT_1428959 [Boletus edulis]
MRAPTTRSLGSESARWITLECKSTSADPLEDVSNNGERANDGSISVWAWTSAIISPSVFWQFPRLLLFLAEPSGGRATLTLPNDWPTGLQPRTVPSYHPLLRPVTAASLVMALLSDNRSVGTLTTTVLVGSSIVGLFGLWMVLAADKHTSSFIFGNKSAASVRKRLWKKEN